MIIFIMDSSVSLLTDYLVCKKKKLSRAQSDIFTMLCATNSPNLKAVKLIKMIWIINYY